MESLVLARCRVGRCCFPRKTKLPPIVSLMFNMCYSQEETSFQDIWSPLPIAFCVICFADTPSPLGSHRLEVGVGHGNVTGSKVAVALKPRDLSFPLGVRR